jgi:hypothetical protein
MSTATKESPETSLRAAIFHYFQCVSSTSTAAASTGAAAAAAPAPKTDENEKDKEKDKEKENTKQHDPPSPPYPKGSKVLAALLEEFPELAKFTAPLLPVPELKVRFEGYAFEVSRRMYLENQVALWQHQRQNPPFAAAPSFGPAMPQPAAAGSKRKKQGPPPSRAEAQSTTRPATKRKDPPTITNTSPKKQKTPKGSPAKPPTITNTNPKKQKPSKGSPAKPVAAAAATANPVRTAASQPPHTQKQPALPPPAAEAASVKLKSEVKRESFSWEERYEQLVSFQKGYGHTRVPGRGRYKENPSLGRWVADQRALYKRDPTLEPEHIAKLNEINFEWVVQAQAKTWQERFEELKEFQREHGHTRVPRNYKKNAALGEWVHSQRVYFRKKNPILVESDRLLKLQAVDFEFIVVPGQTKSWDERFEQLVEFRRTHGHINVPMPKRKLLADKEKDHNGGLARAKRQTQEDEFTFASWVRLQRTAYWKYKNGDRGELTYPRFKKLENIGCEKETVPTTTGQHAGTGHHRRDDTMWSLRMEQLSEYKELHGDCNVPSSYKENKQLADWVKSQRKHYHYWQDGQQSSLTVDRRQALENIGFQWVLRPWMRKENREKKNEEIGEI